MKFADRKTNQKREKNSCQRVCTVSTEMCSQILINTNNGLGNREIQDDLHDRDVTAKRHGSQEDRKVSDTA